MKAAAAKKLRTAPAAAESPRRRPKLVQPSAADEQASRLADLFRLLGDATRLKIVLVCLAEPVAVGEIATVLGLSPSLVSHHLRLLRAAQIVAPMRAGKQVFYTAADHHVREMIMGMIEHMEEPRRPASDEEPQP